jgi:hypothetical protein
MHGEATHPTGRTTGRNILFVLLGIVLVCSSATWIWHRAFGTAADQRQTTANSPGSKSDPMVVGALRPRSLRLSPNVPVISFGIDCSAINALTMRMWPKRNDRLVKVLHALRTFESGSAPSNDKLPGRNELLSVVLDSRVAQEWFDNTSPIIKTRFGLRYSKSEGGGKAGEAHTNQSLAVLAELGLDLETVLSSPAGPSTLKSVFDDAIAHFDPRGEIEWTALALALYFEPGGKWRNRFGHAFDFDQLAARLMARPLERLSCTGTHGLFTLAVLTRINESEKILSAHLSALVREYLTRVSDDVIASQLDDGSIPGDWYVGIVNSRWYEQLCRDLVARYQADDVGGSIREFRTWYASSEPRGRSDLARVLATGHHLEWIFMLPAQMQPKDEPIKRAAMFLASELAAATDEELEESYCPYSHAARVLRLLSRPNCSRPKADITGSDFRPIDDRWDTSEFSPWWADYRNSPKLGYDHVSGTNVDVSRRQLRLLSGLGFGS